MKKYIFPTLSLGLLASAVAFAHSGNVSYQNKKFGPRATTQQEFETVVHNNDLASCVKEVAKACDGDFEKKIAGKVLVASNGARTLQTAATLPSDSQIDAILRSKGVTSCAHIASKSGATSTDYFIRNGQIIIYKTSRANPCRASTIAIANDPVVSAVASAYRGWFTTKAGRTLFMTSTTNVQLIQGVTGATVSADGSQITLAGAGGAKRLLDADSTQSVLGSQTVNVERASPLAMDLSWSLLTL